MEELKNNIEFLENALNGEHPPSVLKNLKEQLDICKTKLRIIENTNSEDEDSIKTRDLSLLIEDLRMFRNKYERERDFMLRHDAPDSQYKKVYNSTIDNVNKDVDYVIAKIIYAL